MNDKTLTAHLLSLKAPPTLSAATHHDFLTLAGLGRLPLSRLALWLSQCRIFVAHGYPRFIGGLISRIPFHESDDINSVEEQFKQEILHELVRCLDNIVVDVKYFKKIANEFQLDLHGWMVRKGTRDYTAEMARISLNSSLEEGIVFMWALEQAYFDAWNYVKRVLPEHPADYIVGKSPRAVIVKLANRWSSPEHIETLANLVNKLDVRPGTEMWRRVESIWMRVMELELGFWPNDGEEEDLKIK